MTRIVVWLATAVLAAVAAAYLNGLYKEANLSHALTALQIEREAAFVKTVMENKSGLSSAGIPPELAGGVCGPAALYATLHGTANLPAATHFAEFVGRLKAQGDLASPAFMPGMRAGQIASALEGLGIAASSKRYISARSEAADIVDAVDSGRLVYVMVDAGQSFKAITGQVMPGPDDRHIISPVAVRRDTSGKPMAVAIYDVNVYSGAPVRQVMGMPMVFVPFQDFVALLGPTLQRNFSLWGTVVISEQPRP